MTTQAEALDRLIAAVEAGKATRTEIEEMAAAVFDLSVAAMNVGSAYAQDDLNAAKALHDALLPGWEWFVGPSNAKVYPYNGNPGVSWSGMADNPARAWLLAVLRAYRGTLV